jgi:hypothetical protein
VSARVGQKDHFENIVKVSGQHVHGHIRVGAAHSAVVHLNVSLQGEQTLLIVDDFLSLVERIEST